MTEPSLRREARIHAIKLAIRRLETGRVRTVAAGTRVSISSVAKEAGLDPATIHTTYPDLAEHIRKLMGRETRIQKDHKASLLKKAHGQNVQLRDEIKALKFELASLASRYANALVEVEQLRATLSPTNSRLFDAGRATRQEDH